MTHRSPSSARRRALLATLAAGIVALPLLVGLPSAVAAPSVSLDSPGDGTQTTASTITTTITVDNTAVWAGAESRTLVGGFSSGSCSVLIEVLLTVNCDVALNDFGLFEVRAWARNAADEYTYTPWVLVTRGGTQAIQIDSPSDDEDVYDDTLDITGTGPSFGLITLSSTVGGGASTPFCTTNVDYDGQFACSAPVPGYGPVTLDATGTDLDGTNTFDTVGFTIIPPLPDVEILASEGSITATANAVAGGNVGLSIRPAGEYPTFCPVSWASGTPGGETETCVFDDYASLLFVESVQQVNGTNSLAREDLAWIPPAPIITGETEIKKGTLLLSGTKQGSFSTFTEAAASGTSVTVYEGDVEVCSANAYGSTTWSCLATLTPGTHTLHAVATAENFRAMVAGYESAVGGISAPSDPYVTGAVGVAGSVLYSLTPGAISARATASPGGELSVELWSFDGEGSVLNDSCPAGATWEEHLYGGPLITCDFGTLAPGEWNVWTNQRISAVEYEVWDDYILIPQAPTLGASVAADGRVTLSGTAEPGALVRVDDANGSQRCSTTASAAGTWSCGPLSANGTTVWRATQRVADYTWSGCDEGGCDAGIRSFRGFSPYSASAVTSVLAQTGGNNDEPPAPTPPVTWTLDGLSTTYKAGQTVALSGDGLIPGSRVDVEIRSTPRQLGTTAANAVGYFQITVTIPADLEPGKHTLVVIVTPPGGGAATSQSQTVTILAPDAGKTAAAPPAKDPEAVAAAAAAAAAGGEGDGSGPVDRSLPGAPTSLTSSVPTAEEIFRQPLSVLGAGGLALALLLLVAFPTELLNSTLSSNSQRLGRGFAAVEGAIARATAWFIAVTRTPALAAAVVVLITSVIFGFVDPDFGFDLASLRLVLSLGIALFLVSYVTSWISGAIIKRAWGVESSIQLQPAALIFAVGGVALARVLDFSPGFLVGLVIGLEIATRTKEPYRSRATVVQLGVLAGVAVVAWIAYSIATGMMPAEPNFGQALTVDTLSATVVEGLTAAAVAILPLGFLEGRELFKHSKRLWLAVFLGLALLFSLLVLPLATNASGPSDWLVWGLVLIGFAAVTLIVWAIFQFTGRNDDPHEEDENAVTFEQADAR